MGRECEDAWHHERHLRFFRCPTCAGEWKCSHPAPVPGPPGERPKFSEIYMRLAFLMASRSTCSRLHVGCVITSMDNRKVLSVGYNGGAAGQDNDCEVDAAGQVVAGQCGHLHAEENAIINLDCPRDVPKLVYVTTLPCKMCCKRLVNVGGVVRVTYADDYRLRDGLKVLELARVEVWQAADFARRDGMPPVRVDDVRGDGSGASAGR